MDIKKQLLIKKLEAEKTAVQASRLNMECRLIELEQMIETIKSEIKIQLDKEQELEIKINELKKEE
jgi:hypothetical protein